ncbi:MAG: hypothetical protein U0T69_06665 [Chitinophagales bacterium]
MKQVFCNPVLLPVFLLLFFISSCKKDDDSKSPTNITSRKPVDDPDVEVQTFNVNINTNRSGTYLDTVIKAFSLEFHINAYQYTNVYKDISIYTGYASDLYLHNEVVFRVGQRSDNFIPSFLEGYKIDTYEGAWNTTYGDPNYYGSIYTKENDASFGFNGLGDRYFAFRKKVSGSYQYGYIKLNLSEDANTLNIKSIAYCNIPNKSFYYGDY